MSGDGGSKTRRELLSDIAKAAAAASLTGMASCFPDVGGKWPMVLPICEDDDASPIDGPGSTVVEVHREEALDSSTSEIDRDSVNEMLDAGLKALAGGSDDYWSVLLPDYQSGQRIGLKVNCLNPSLPTSRAVVAAVIASLRDRLDVDTSDIVVWDRFLSELSSAGKYSSDDLAGAKLLGTTGSDYRDTDGPGYSEVQCGVVCGSVPRLSKILTEQTDLTINLPVLKTHGVSGITGALKNVYGVIDIPKKYHDNIGTALPSLYRLPPIRKHIQLTIIDALIAVINRDTQQPPDATPCRLLMAKDPLALDRYALDLINKLRAEFRTKSLPPVNSELTGWLDEGYNQGLGTKEYNLIQV